VYRRLGTTLAVAALAVAFASAAQADNTPPPDGTTVSIECSDGTVWTVDSSWTPDSLGQLVCDGGYTIVQPDATTNSGSGDSSSPASPSDGGIDLSLDAGSNIAPDPVEYVTDVQCPNGQIWAVASGDDFVCPAA